MSAAAEVLRRYRDQHALRAAIGLMSWDQQVLMPKGGAAARSAHMQALSKRRHALVTDPELWDLVLEAEAQADPGSDEARSLAAFRRDLETERKLPADLVARKAKASAEAYDTWKPARAESNFAAMIPHYRELFAIAAETAEVLGPREHPYDALIDLYEKGATYAQAQAMFEAITPAIQELIASRPSVDDSVLAQDFDRPRLRAFMQETCGQIGFDFSRGRLDLAPNAFCSSNTHADVRMTTRPSNHLKGVVSSSLHEMGHGLYEQGMPPEWAGTPIAGGISLAVHESQSRMWENIIGRSRAFWTFFFPRLQAAFPEFQSMSLDAFVAAVNKVEPGFIRVGADELSYNLHIRLRFDLEVLLITGQLRIEDLPEAWNAKMKEYLGIVPPDDGLGVLQDVHWARGSVGYFPTYAMGNLIGAQIWETLRADIPDADRQMERGDFATILGWLQEKIYRQGRRYLPDELVTRVTGRPMEAGPWVAYAREKYG